MSDLDLDKIASVLYPGADAKPARDLAPKLTYTDEEVRQGEKFYPPRGVDPDRPQPGEGLYAASAALRKTCEKNATRLFDHGLLSHADAETERHEFASVVRAQHLDFGFGRLLHDELTSARIADARHDEAGGDTALAAQIRHDITETRRALRERFGPAEAERLIDRVERFKAQDPRLSAILSTRGLLWRPAVFQGLLDHVRATAFF